MPKDYEVRVPQSHIKSTVYIYSSEQEARGGVPAGGSGFFVGVHAGISDKYFTYVVTNAHVIAHCSEYPFIRVNKKGGGFEFISVPKESWHLHPDGDDIAVSQIGGLGKLDLDIGFIATAEFVTEKNLLVNDMHLGPGDPTYMTGRFTNHEGVSTNTPIVRYGNISLNPDKMHTVKNPSTMHEDEVFLIEARSVSGYSGSAVFTFINEFDYRDKVLEVTGDMNMIPLPYFLGINIGHTRMMLPIQAKNHFDKYMDVEVEGSGKLYSESNSGIMRIAPAWKLQEMLDMEIFVDIRKKVKKQAEEEKKKSFSLDSIPNAPDVKKNESINISEKDFKDTLKKVSRKKK